MGDVERALSRDLGSIGGVFFGGPMDGQLRVVEQQLGQVIHVSGFSMRRRPLEVPRLMDHTYLVEVNPANDGPTFRFRYQGEKPL